MHRNDSIIFVAMGMGVVFGRFAVGCPTRMTYTAKPVKIFPVMRYFAKNLQFALCFDYIYITRFVAYRYSRRVVASVFKLCKSVKYYGSGLPAARVSYNSAHCN